MPSQESRLGTHVLRSSDGKFIMAQKKKTESGTLEVKLCAVDRQKSPNNVPSVQIYKNGNDRAFIFRHDNNNYYLTVEKNKLKLKEGNDRIYCFTHLDLGAGEHHVLQTRSIEPPNELWYLSRAPGHDVLILTTNPANCIRVKVENRTIS